MTVHDYMQLPYTILIRHITDESGTYWYTSVLEFDGCQTTSDTQAEAFADIHEAMQGWIETKLANGFSVPLPEDKEDENYSGKFNIRIPKALHRKLAVQAKMQNVSLNQYVLYKLAM